MYLPKLTYAYNTSVQESTKQTPFEMMFGSKPKLLIDTKCGNNSRRRRNRVRQIIKWVMRQYSITKKQSKYQKKRRIPLKTQIGDERESQ